jgi:hypothetical protein
MGLYCVGLECDETMGEHSPQRGTIDMIIIHATTREDNTVVIDRQTGLFQRSPAKRFGGVAWAFTQATTTKSNQKRKEHRNWPVQEEKRRRKERQSGCTW